MQNSKLIYKSPSWDAEQRKAIFSYRLEHGNKAFDFTESLIFPSTKPISNIPQKLLHNVLDSLSLILGISYYKLYCPKKLILEGMQLSKEQADFWNIVYSKGLGEFFYQNRIDFRDLISFPFKTTPFIKENFGFARRKRSLVGIGGGKDSIVTAELLKALKKPFADFAVNNHKIKEEVTHLLGTDLILIRRDIDPKLLEMNKRSDVYNGHVPVSAIYAFIGLLSALLYDYTFIVVSNEQSANYGNTAYLGQTINHQWSKSFEFEQLFQKYIKTYLTPDIQYFSLLRPLSEITIAKYFVGYPQYFPIFSSCNKNYKIKEITNKKWCAQCPKCAFIFTILSAFLPKYQLMNIFGQNLFSQTSLLQTYKKLLGISPIKPFDCVGTPEEVQLALYLAMQKNEYINTPVMKLFQKEVLPKIKNIDNLSKEVFNLSDKHRIPKEFQATLKSLRVSHLLSQPA